MCGIVGHWGPKTTKPWGYADALALLRHRGPDDFGSRLFHVREGELVLGHTRLSIIDLSEGGHQPMTTPDGRHTFVFNGELYNYRELRSELSTFGRDFGSESDSEVLLQAWSAWGKACLSRLKGMFAFAVFDAETSTLTLVRDAFGIKPLYYSESDGTLTFASEVMTVLTGRQKRSEINRKRAYEYLLWGNYDFGHETFFAEVKTLPPGHLIEFRLTEGASGEAERWWHPTAESAEAGSFELVAEELRDKFLKNVRLHLRSDVPVGAALSGGLDSAAVVCAMRKLEPDMDIKTFTYTSGAWAKDEMHWSGLVSSQVRATAHAVSARAMDLARDLDELIVAQGEPFGSTSIYAQFRVMQAAREAGVKVILEGQGADELLGGYAAYPGPRMHSLLDGHHYGQLIRFLGAWSSWPGRPLPWAVRDLISQVLPKRILRTAYLRSGLDVRPQWLAASATPAELVHDHLELGQSTSLPHRRLTSALRHAMTNRGLPALLRHSDRNSMHWSVESRVPFLTHDLAEFTLGLPEDYLVSMSGQTKSVFRAAMRGIVPDEILQRRDKVGFETPESEWLRTMGPQVIEWVEGAKVVDFLDIDGCRMEVASALAGDRPLEGRTWRLLNLCRWAQVMGDHLS